MTPPMLMSFLRRCQSLWLESHWTSVILRSVAVSVACKRGTCNQEGQMATARPHVSLLRDLALYSKRGRCRTLLRRSLRWLRLAASVARGRPRAFCFKVTVSLECELLRPRVKHLSCPRVRCRGDRSLFL